MEKPAINRPTPMTPETRILIPREYFDADNFFYGNNWVGMVLYYKIMYPGFTVDQSRAMEACCNGVTPKQWSMEYGLHTSRAWMIDHNISIEKSLGRIVKRSSVRLIL